MSRRIPNTNSTIEVRQAFERLIDDTGALSAGGLAGYVLVGTGIGSSATWTTSLTALTLLTVDNITINAAAITSDTGAISFDNENISTTGTISGVNVTSGADPGHTHDALYFRETEFIATSTGVPDAGKPVKLNASGIIDGTMISVGGIDHGGLGGLGDDDHAQYHNDTRGDARYYTETELDAGQLDNRYYRENEHINTSAGAADAGKPIVLDAGGQVDATMVNDGDIDHGSIGGLADDDHTQYHNDTRGDARYYTETELNAGQLNNLYYTETELDAGQLDNRYYRENEHISISTGAPDAGKPIVLDAGGQVDATMINDGDVDHGGLGGLADDDHTQYHNDTRGDARYYTETELNAGQLDTRYYTETELDAGQLDNRYFRENEHLTTSAGVGDAGKPIKLNASGLVDSTMLPPSVTDHGGLSGLLDDDHTQYLLIDGTRAMTGGFTATSIVTSKTWTSYSAADAYGISLTSIVNTGWITGWNYGFFAQGYCNGNVGDASMQVMGGIGRGYFQSSGTLGWLIGLKGDCYVYNAAASGTVQKAASFYAQYIAYGGGATATITTSYAFYAEDRTVGGTRWAFYHTGVDNSRVGGRLGVGGDPSNGMLDITLSEAGTAARQDCINTTYTNTGTSSYNSIGRGVQGAYINTTCGIATNYNGIYIIPQTNNAATSNIGTLCAIQLYTGFGYHASATVGTAIGVYIKGWGNQAPGTFTEHYGIKIDAISGANTNYAILTTSGLVVLNENGTDSDTRIEGDNVANLFVCDAGNDKVGIGTATPDGKFDVNFSLAGTAAEQNLITGGFLQTGANSYNTEGRGTQGLFVNVLSHGATNLNGIYIKVRGDNNHTISQSCAIQTYTFYGEDGAGCTLTTAIGVYIKGLGGTTPATFTNHYGLKIDRITGAATLNYAIHTTGGEIVFNDGGYGDSDVRMESDLDANCFFLDTSANNIGIGNSDPQVRLDITNAADYVGLRIRNTKTPASAAAAGNKGDICWDASYIYVCVATNSWTRAAIAAW